MPHRKNVLMWCISMYHVTALKQTHSIKKHYSEGGKKIGGCRGLLRRVINITKGTKFYEISMVKEVVCSVFLIYD